MKRSHFLALGLLAVLLIPGYGQERPFGFVMLSDPQFGMYSGNDGFAQETANYEFAIAAVNSLKPAFVIVLGDLVNRAGDPSQIAEYLRISAKADPSIPIYHVAGNHDVGNEPTPESLATYRKSFGRDYYSFRAGPLYAIVLNSTLIHAPKNVTDAYEEQEIWLKKELGAAQASGASHIVVFQHHPYFLKEASEADRYENIPLERRQALLDLFRSHGVSHIFAGHYHQNALGRDSNLEMITTGPVGKPLGQDGSGIRVAVVEGAGIKHRYFDFGFLPEKLEK